MRTVKKTTTKTARGTTTTTTMMMTTMMKRTTTTRRTRRIWGQSTWCVQLHVLKKRKKPVILNLKRMEMKNLKKRKKTMMKMMKLGKSTCLQKEKGLEMMMMMTLVTMMEKMTRDHPRNRLRYPFPQAEILLIWLLICFFCNINMFTTYFIVRALKDISKCIAGVGFDLLPVYGFYLGFRVYLGLVACFLWSCLLCGI